MAASAPAAIEALAARFLAAQLQGDRDEALRLVLDDGIGRGIAAADVYLGVIQPTQYEIGRLWQENRISVAQEHLATAISQLVVANLYRHLPRAPRNGKLVIVACPPGELHELGARVAADFLDMTGFSVTYLGANVPTMSLVGMIQARRPDAVVLSAATSLCFPELRDTVRAVAEVAGPHLPILVGGSAFTWSDACPIPAGTIHARGDAFALVDAVRQAVGA